VGIFRGCGDAMPADLKNEGLKRLAEYWYRANVMQDAGEAIGQLNWAEELHETLGKHIRDNVRRGANKEETERFISWRAKRNAPSAPRSGRRPNRE
jgi:hypothetical protein